VRGYLYVMLVAAAITYLTTPLARRLARAAGIDLAALSGSGPRGRVKAADVEAALRDGAGELLESVRLFDVFTGDQVGEDKKSLAYALRFRARDRTLTADEASAARDAAVSAAVTRTGATLRGA